MKLRINIKSQIRVLSFHLIGTIVIFIALLILNFEKYMLISFGAIWVLLSVPTVYLHMEYFFRNKNECIEITDNQILVKTQEKENRSFRFDELKKIILYKSASIEKGGFPITPVEFYHYARIIPKKGEDIIITCLMIPNVEDAVKEIKWVSYERKKILFSSLNYTEF